MQLIVDNLLTNYQKTGSGKALLLLHGWGDSLVTFRDFDQELSKKYTVISLDMPGFGGTQPPASAWGLEDYVHFINSFLKKAGIRKVYAIIGHSFGGQVAIWGTGQAKFKPAKLVLLDSAGVRGQRPLLRRIMWLGAKTLKAPLYLLPAHKAMRIKRALYKKVGSDMLLLPHMRQTFSCIVGQDVRAEAAKIKQQTLLIYGRKDKETPVDFGQKLRASIPNSQLEIVEGAGHFAHHDKPDQVLNLIVEFL